MKKAVHCDNTHACLAPSYYQICSTLSLSKHLYWIITFKSNALHWDWNYWLEYVCVCKIFGFQMMPMLYADWGSGRDIYIRILPRVSIYLIIWSCVLKQCERYGCLLCIAYLRRLVYNTAVAAAWLGAVAAAWLGAVAAAVSAH